MTVLLICGSRVANYKMLDYVDFSIREAVKARWTIMVGDNHLGVDMRVIEYCEEIGYKDVCVMSNEKEPARSLATLRGAKDVKSKLTAEQYANRDRLMADMADRGLFIWNGKSPGTLALHEYMKSLYKPVSLANFGKPQMKLTKTQLKPEPVEKQIKLF